MPKMAAVLYHMPRSCIWCRGETHTALMNYLLSSSYDSLEGWCHQLCQDELWKRSWLTIWAELDYHISFLRGKKMWSLQKKGQCYLLWNCNHFYYGDFATEINLILYLGMGNTSKVKHKIFMLWLAPESEEEELQSKANCVLCFDIGWPLVSWCKQTFP